MDGCIYRTKDGECDLYSEGGKFKAFCDPEHCDNIAPTNADRIRAMTDEELAMLLGAPTIVLQPWCNMDYDCPYIDQDPARCDLCALDWLKQEATDGT